MRSPFALAALIVMVSLPAWSGKKDKKVATPPPVAESPDLAAQAPANPAAQAAVKYRHNLMESLGKHMKLSSMIVKGEVTQPTDMLLHAQALHGAADSLPTLFPKGSDPGSLKTDSLPSVWKDWDGFIAANDAYRAEAAKLVEVAKAGDLEGFKAQFSQVGRKCGACHDTYRVDED